jgi:hypothetical protein
MLACLVFMAYAGAGQGTGGSNGDVIDFRGVRIDKAKRTVAFEATINQHDGPLEYLLVNEKGKTHESLLATKIDPYDIQVAMLLLGINPAGQASARPPEQIDRKYLEAAPKLKGEKIDVYLEWKAGAGVHRARAEDLIHNSETNATMTPGPWIYNGSEMYNGRFLAQVDGSITALVRDPAALMNNPRPGNDDDQIWEVNSTATPAIGTPVDVIVQLEQIGAK